MLLAPFCQLIHACACVPCVAFYVFTSKLDTFFFFLICFKSNFIAHINTLCHFVFWVPPEVLNILGVSFTLQTQLNQVCGEISNLQSLGQKKIQWETVGYGRACTICVLLVGYGQWPRSLSNTNHRLYTSSWATIAVLLHLQLVQIHFWTYSPAGPLEPALNC